jgi:hypothetical protein
MFILIDFFDFSCFNATFSNISAISWRPVLVVEEAGVPGENKIFFCLVFYRHFQQYFSYIMATSFSGGRSQSTRREPPTMGKQLVNLTLAAVSRGHPS